MSSFIPGLSDTIPQAQPFQPDFNYYSGVLGAKQNQYDQGLQKINSLYGSALNSPMTRMDNIDRRDKYFKTIEQDIQKAARMDLSIDQNVSVAKTLFDPVINDKNIVHDMAFTKGLQNAYGEAESYRNCVDPAKCGGKFSEDNIRALHYAAEDYQKADPKAALMYSAPKYVPDQDVFGNAIKAAKDFGFNVSFDHISNGYQVKDTNGQLLLGTKGDGVLQQFLYGIFGQDSKVQQMYQTKALLARRDFAKANATRYGSEDLAERAYLMQAIPDATHTLTKSKQDLNDLQSELTANQKALAAMLPNSVEGDGTKSAHDTVMALIDDSKVAEGYHTDNDNRIRAAQDSGDIVAMRGNVDGLVANGLFMHTINSAAYTYAMGTAKQDVQGADPYALASFNSNLDLNKAAKLKEMDNEIWMKQQYVLGNIDWPFGGTGPTEVLGSKAQAKREARATAAALTAEAQAKGINLVTEGIDVNTPEGVAKAAKLGLGKSPEIKKSALFISPSPDAQVYETNAGQFHSAIQEATDKVGNRADQFFVDTITSKLQSYKAALANMQGPDGTTAKREKIVSDIQKIFKGTAVNANDVIDGKVSVQNALNASAKDKDIIINRAFAIRNGDISAGIYNNADDETALSELQTSYQALSGLRNVYKNDVKQAVTKSNADFVTKAQASGMPEEEFMIKNLARQSLVDEQGIADPVVAKQKYLNTVASRYAPGAGGTSMSAAATASGAVPADQMKSILSSASKYFDENYGALMMDIDSHMISLNSKAKSKDSGGMQGNENSALEHIDGTKPFDTSYIRVKNTLEQVMNGPEAIRARITGSGAEGLVPNIGNLMNAPEAVNLMEKTLTALNTGDQKDLNLTVRTTVLPPQYKNVDYNKVYRNQQGFGEEITPQEVVMRVTVGEDFYKKQFGLKAADIVSEAQRTFVVTAPTSAVPAAHPFLAALYISPEDKYLRTPGASLTTSIPGKGTITVSSDGAGGYIVKPGAYQLVKGEKTFVPYGEIKLASSPTDADAELYSVNKAFEVGRNMLNQAAERFEYTKNLQKNALNP